MTHCRHTPRWGGTFSGSGCRSIALRRFASTLATRCPRAPRSEEHTSEHQSLMRISYAVFCLKKQTTINIDIPTSAYMMYNKYHNIAYNANNTANNTQST